MGEIVKNFIGSLPEVNEKDLKMTIKFSDSDASQIQIAKLLKNCGRKKAQFITTAAMYYLSHCPSPEVPGNNSITTGIITESVIRATIMDMINSGQLKISEDSGNGENPKKQQKQKKNPNPFVKKEKKDSNVEKVPVPIVPPPPIQKQEEHPEQDDSIIQNMLDMLDDF